MAVPQNASVKMDSEMHLYLTVPIARKKIQNFVI